MGPETRRQGEGSGVTSQRWSSSIIQNARQTFSGVLHHGHAPTGCTSATLRTWLAAGNRCGQWETPGGRGTCLKSPHPYPLSDVACQPHILAFSHWREGQFTRAHGSDSTSSMPHIIVILFSDGFKTRNQQMVLSRLPLKPIQGFSGI